MVFNKFWGIFVLERSWSLSSWRLCWMGCIVRKYRWRIGKQEPSINNHSTAITKLSNTFGSMWKNSIIRKKDDSSNLWQVQKICLFLVSSNSSFYSETSKLIVARQAVLSSNPWNTIKRRTNSQKHIPASTDSNYLFSQINKLSFMDSTQSLITSLTECGEYNDFLFKFCRNTSIMGLCIYVFEHMMA